MVENRLQNNDCRDVKVRGTRQDLLEERVVPQFRRAAEMVGGLIKDHPLGSIAVGLAAGVALGCLAKRR